MFKPVIGIDYTEFDPESYRAVTVNRRGHGVRRFSTGEVVKDWQLAMEYVETFSKRVKISDTVNDFISDTGKYRLRGSMLVELNPWENTPMSWDDHDDHEPWKG